MPETNNNATMDQHRVNTVVTWLIIVMGIVNVAWLAYQGTCWEECAFRGLQYFTGALVVAIYGFIRHDKLVERYKGYLNKATDNQ